MLKWVRLIGIILAIALPALVSYKKAITSAQSAPIACATDSECVVRGVDEWERCHHVNDPPGDEKNGSPSHDATSKTHDGFKCLCVSHECSWAGLDYQLCAKTGGHFMSLKDCPVCPEGAVCEKCLTGCSCPQGQVFDAKAGCQSPSK